MKKNIPFIKMSGAGNDFIVIDSPGSDTYLSHIAHSHADTIVTPINDSFVDLDVLATVDGQTTAHYITELLQGANVKVTRLAHGVPVGGELDYLDEGTLSAAIKQRTLF